MTDAKQIDMSLNVKLIWETIGARQKTFQFCNLKYSQTLRLIENQFDFNCTF